MNDFTLRHKHSFRGDTADLLEIFRDEPHLFLLESSIRDPRQGRYSFIGFDPFEVLQEKNDTQLKKLRSRFKRYACHRQDQTIPFSSGIAGYFSYDLGNRFENIREGKINDLRMPGYMFGFYDTGICVDHYKNEVIITSTGLPEKTMSLRKKRAEKRLKAIILRIKRVCETGKDGIGTARNGHKKNTLRMSSNLTKTKYVDVVKKAKEYIRQGDIYQVNLSQRFRVDLPAKKKIDPIRIYRVLRDLSPSCFGAYFDAQAFQVISSSPELFLRLKNKDVETRPMKGTRPRGRTRKNDHLMRRQLLQSPKDKAELLMITDLERNDLGRVCRYGSVKMEELRTLEKYRTVYQATSTVSGRLRDDKDGFDLLRACFPGGSITGCPKIRAMQIIEELEPSRRNLYTGSLGFMDFGGNLEFNILIRSLLVQNRKIYFHVGGGIVADSTPEGEYAETLVKARAMQECLGRVLG